MTPHHSRWGDSPRKENHQIGQDYGADRAINEALYRAWVDANCLRCLSPPAACLLLLLLLLLKEALEEALLLVLLAFPPHRDAGHRHTSDHRGTGA